MVRELLVLWKRGGGGGGGGGGEPSPNEPPKNNAAKRCLRANYVYLFVWRLVEQPSIFHVVFL